MHGRESGSVRWPAAAAFVSVTAEPPPPLQSLWHLQMRHPRRRESRRWPAVALWSSCDPWAAARGPGGAQPSSPRGIDTRQGNAHACGGEHIRWWFADSSAKSTTKQARARAPMCARRRAQCGPRERPLANISKSGRDGQRGAAAQHTHYGAVHRDAGQPRAMPAWSAPPGASSARSSALSSRFGARFSARTRVNLRSRRFICVTSRDPACRVKQAQPKPETHGRTRSTLMPLLTARNSGCVVCRVTYLPFAFSSDASCADLPLPLLGAPVSIGALVKLGSRSLAKQDRDWSSRPPGTGPHVPFRRHRGSAAIHPSRSRD